MQIASPDRDSSESYWQKAKLAMSVRGSGRHHQLDNIQTRHWQGLAQCSGIDGLWERMAALADSLDGAMRRIEQTLPAGFPERV